MSSDQFLGICAVIIAIGGVLEVCRRYVIAPVTRFIRAIVKALHDIADLLDRMTSIETTVGEMHDVLAEIKGALRATGILPDDD